MRRAEEISDECHGNTSRISTKNDNDCDNDDNEEEDDDDDDNL